jgi:hypothetical protein
MPTPNTNPEHPEDMPVWTDTQDPTWPPADQPDPAPKEIEK